MKGSTRSYQNRNGRGRPRQLVLEKLYAALLLVGRASGLGFVVHPKFVGRSNISRIGVQQTLVIGSQAELDEGPGIRGDFGLPAIGRLVAGQGVAGGRVPSTCGLPGEVVLVDEGGLDFPRTLGVNPALAVGTKSRFLRSFAGMMAGRGIGLAGLRVFRFGLGGCRRRRRARRQQQHQNDYGDLKYTIPDRQRPPLR